MMKWLFKRFIVWQLRRRPGWVNLKGSDNIVGTKRFMLLWPDEYWVNDVLYNKRPWYLPFNIFMHRWFRSDDGMPHDHPRWTITIVLRGAMREETPDQVRYLTPGSVVFRSHRAIHRIVIPRHFKGKTWTIFITGRRLWRQHYYCGDQQLPVEFTE